MLSSLYGDLPQAKADDAAEKPNKASTPGWASKLTPVPRKPPAFIGAPASVLRGRGRGPAGGRGPGAGRGDGGQHGPGGAEGARGSDAGGANSLMSLAGPVEDEYDPARPNDYEAIMRAREAARKVAQMEAERQEKLREQERREQEAQREAEERREREDRYEDEQDEEERDDRDRERSPEPNRGEVLGISGEEAFLRRGRLSGRSSGFSGGDERVRERQQAPGGGYNAASAAAAAEKGMTLAQRMMEKMGWKEGQGLGRNKQGITAPLVASKTSARAGVVAIADDRPAVSEQDGRDERDRNRRYDRDRDRDRDADLDRDRDRDRDYRDRDRDRDHRDRDRERELERERDAEPEPALPPEKKARQGTKPQGQPSKVIVLRNMVGPGEVDDDLEDDVGNECTKYGNVQTVLIFEVTEPGFPPEEAVRIFVEFDRLESATKALIDLDGRFFGGNVVRADFFDERRFELQELAPLHGEFG